MLVACYRAMHHSMPPTSVLLAAISCLVSICPLPVLAASTDAWAAHRQEVTKACIRASGLVDARLVGSVISFDDSVGRSAALIAGRYPQAHMARAKGLSLCLFDKRTRTAQTTPADDWR
jgi:hypothetical protein